MAVTVLLASGGAALWSGGTASAGGSATWSASSLPLPTDGVAAQGGEVRGLACPAAGWCVAVGGYDGTVGDEGLIAVDSGGGFTSTRAPLPPDASPSTPSVYLNAVACPAQGSCVVVGTYQTQNGQTEGVGLTLGAAGWSATGLPLPSGAVGVDGPLTLAHVACLSASQCIAVGGFTDGLGRILPLVETDAGGSWTAQAAPVPGDALASAPCSGPSSCFGAQSRLDDISCPTPGVCTAIGTYAVGLYQPPGAIEPIPEVQSFVVDLAGGAWSATALPLPADANTNASAGDVGVDYWYWGGWSISCPAIGQCAATGHYHDAAGALGDLVDQRSGGSWSSMAAPLPGDAGDQSPIFDDGLSVSCGGPGSCVAVGYYRVAPTADQVNASFIDELVGGTWTTMRAPAPGGATGGGQYLTFVSCPAPGQCVAGGVDGADSGAFVENQQAGSWAAQQAPTPGLDATAGLVAFAGASCPAVGACAAALTYFTTSGVALVVEIDPVVGVGSPSTSPPAMKRGRTSMQCRVGRACLLQLGAIGTPSPTLSESGTLPSGLRFLTPAPGRAVVRGIPAHGTSGSYTITIDAANTAGASAPIVVHVGVR